MFAVKSTADLLQKSSHIEFLKYDMIEKNIKLDSGKNSLKNKLQFYMIYIERERERER
jgi:uncharacterized protein YccT (UPF0319 family)